MKDSVFRKKSIERIDSPENLNNYIRVAEIPSWIILIVIILLLLGVILWGIRGKLVSTALTMVESDGKATYCYVNEEDIGFITDDMKVTVNGTDYRLGKKESIPKQAGELLDDYGLHLSEWNYTDYVYIYDMPDVLDEGIYNSGIVVESIHPIEYLWN